MKTKGDPRLLAFYLSALRDLGAALARGARGIDGTRPLRESLYRVLGTLAIGRGALAIWDDEQHKLTRATAKGLRPGKGLERCLTPAHARRLAAAPRPFHPHMPPGGLETIAERLRGALGRTQVEWVVPLSTGGAFIGLLLLGGRLNGEPLNRVEMDILEEMATILALRIEEMRTRRRLDAQVRQLQQLNRQLRQIYIETIRTLASVIDGPPAAGGRGHSVRVAALAYEIGRRLGLRAERCERLYVAGLLHDIGKQIISREILGKREALTAEERRQLESHPAAGCELISHLRFPWGDVAEIIRHHHERLDGSGYPDRLSSEQISIEAKVLMMAEAFDSMTSDQPWRPRLSTDKVLGQIAENLGLQFEPAVAEALCGALEAGLEGQARLDDFVPHLEATFDPATIRELIAELRRQVQGSAMRAHARVIDVVQAEKS